MSVKIQVTSFSGKKKDWPSWRVKFLAQSRVIKFSNILKGTEKVPDESSPSLTEEEKKIIEHHEDGFTELILAMEDEVLAMEVANCIRGEHQDGDLLIACNMLNNNFQPKGTSNMIEIQDKLFD